MAKSKRDELIGFALGFPEARLDHPWGEDVAKVGMKIFAFFSASEEYATTVKLPSSNEFAVPLPDIQPAGTDWEEKMGNHLGGCESRSLWCSPSWP
ncbi:MAG: hypothetical protein ACR2HJ_11090 [Fimbriimonadales bacterium]